MALFHDDKGEKKEAIIIRSKIGIIGAGVSGIAAAKQLRQHNPIVFEATDSIGGVWRHCSFNSTKLQSQRRDYEFTDYPWPNNRDNSDFPTHLEILDYLHSYANHFDILKTISFNSKVLHIRFLGSHARPFWHLAVQNTLSHTIQWYGFEFVVICMGKYGDVAQIPAFPRSKGPETFKGKVLHTLDYCKLNNEEATQLFKGKNVAVVGFKKSAIDLAMECALANQGCEGQRCTMVVRTAHWTVPHYWVWGLPLSIFYTNRSSQFLHERPNQGFIKTLLTLLLSPMRRGMSKFIESYLLWKLPLEKYGLIPDHSFDEDYASCQMAILPENFFSEAEKGKIAFKKASSKWWFWEGGIEFDDNTKLEADVVVLATGYDGKQKLKSIMEEPFRSLLDYPSASGVMPLYRGTIHPLIPNMAFLGYVESVANLHSSEIRSLWLSALLDQKFMLPTVPDMLAHTLEEVEVMKRTSRFYKRHCISTYSINHTDQICHDLGWTSWRKNNWLAEAFSHYSSEDYQNKH
ncbi:probable flavin-containing monooxygenase 1 [Arachis stenosperma]|uniref:probable flavin-containing monooxygenase 1 n=1 Tax=Arachis stenosperma TaxID=217475 RepID=UPI0025AC04F2|nr:probable flavin-containing monooxygenase 1 [Arachis stenosperma]